MLAVFFVSINLDKQALGIVGCVSPVKHDDEQSTL